MPRDVVLLCRALPVSLQSVVVPKTTGSARVIAGAKSILIAWSCASGVPSAVRGERPALIVAHLLLELFVVVFAICWLTNPGFQVSREIDFVKASLTPWDRLPVQRKSALLLFFAAHRWRERRRSGARGGAQLARGAAHTAS